MVAYVHVLECGCESVYRFTYSHLCRSGCERVEVVRAPGCFSYETGGVGCRREQSTSIVNMYGIGVERGACACSFFEFVHNDVLVGAICWRGARWVGLVLVGVVQNNLPRRVAGIDFLLGFVVKFAPICFVGALPVGIFLDCFDFIFRTREEQPP